MDQLLLYTIFFGIILLIGLLSSIISRKLKIPNLLFLLLIGMGIGYITHNGQPLLQFDSLFLASLAIITLALVVFESSSKFKFKEFDTLSLAALKLSIIFLILNVILLSVAANFLFKFDSILLAVIFAVVVSGTDPSSTLMILGGARSKIFELLKIEAILNTPLIVLIPFLIVDMIKNTAGLPLLSILSSQALPFAQQFVTGIGAGMLIGLLFSRFMKKYYSATLSPLALITAAILAYVLSEVLGGNGVLGVTTAGLLFGNLYHIKHLKILQKFGEVFSEILEILVFVLIGSIIKIPWTLSFLIPATILFLVYLVLRYLSVFISFRKLKHTFKENLYMTLNIPKGIAVAVVIFTLATKSVAGIKPVLDLILLFMIYSIVLSTAITHFSKYFTKVDIKIVEQE